MNYRILIPVTVNADRVKILLDNIKDKILLTIVNNFDDIKIAELCRNAEKEGAEIIWKPENIGIGRSWNIGLRQVGIGRCDYIFIFSASIIFHEPMEYFVEKVWNQEQKEKKFTYALHTASKHWFVTTKLGVEKMGYYDENFCPCYYEDTDYCYRRTLSGYEKEGMFHIFEPQGISSAGTSLAIRAEKRILKHYELNSSRMMNYYIRKWGGLQGKEIYKTPYNDPNMKINDWILETEGFISLSKEIS